MSLEEERRRALIMTCSQDHDTNRLGMALMRDTLPTEEEDRVANEVYLDWEQSAERRAKYAPRSQ